MKNRKIVLLVTVLIFALLPFCVKIFWSAADDPRYIFMVSGAYTGEHSGSLLYVGSVWGNFVAWLYKLVPGLEWYSLIYYLLFVVSVSLLSNAILCSTLSREVKCVFWVVLVVTHLYMAISPQSTFLASDLSISTIVLIRGKRSHVKLMLAFCLFFVATQLRLFGALMPYMIALPIFLLSKDMTFVNVRRYVLPFAVFFALSCVSFCADYLKYHSTTEWTQFKRFDAARCYITDNPLSGELIGGIHGKEDKLAYMLFQKYRIYDTNVLPVDKMVHYAEVMKTYRLQNIRNNIAPYAKFYLSFGFLSVFLLIMWGGVSFIYDKKYKHLLLLMGVFVLFLIANLFMMAQSEAKERALMGALFSLLFSVLVIMGQNIKYSRVCYLLLVLGVGWHFARHIKANIGAVPAKVAYLEETESVLNGVSFDKIYMPVPSCIDPDIFHSSNSPIAKKTVIQGWMQIFPESNPAYRHLTAFVHGLPILVRKDAMEQVFWIQRLLLLHYGLRTGVSTLQTTDHYNLIELKSN